AIKRRLTEESVLLTDFPTGNAKYLNPDLAEQFQELIEVRYTVNKALEEARANKKIGSSLEAQVAIRIEDAGLAKKLSSLGPELPGFLITSQAKVVESHNGKEDML